MTSFDSSVGQTCWAAVGSCELGVLSIDPFSRTLPRQLSDASIGWHFSVRPRSTETIDNHGVWKKFKNKGRSIFHHFDWTVGYLINTDRWIVTTLSLGHGCSIRLPASLSSLINTTKALLTEVLEPFTKRCNWINWGWWRDAKYDILIVGCYIQAHY